MAVYKRGSVWWFKFNWKGQTIRESTKQGNKRIAEQIEAGRRTQLAKGEVGIRDKAPAPTLAEFSEKFLQYTRDTFHAKQKTVTYYEQGVKHLLNNPELADSRLDTITVEHITRHAAERRDSGLKISSVNRQLEVLRRMFHLAMEWGSVDKLLPKVRLVPGEAQRERVLTTAEEVRYLESAQQVGLQITASYERAIQRKQTPATPRDPYILRDIATVLLDCGLRPEECFRLRWTNLEERGDALMVYFGKTDNARRRIPLPDRAKSILESRLKHRDSTWIFPAPTRSGHAEPSTIRDHHSKAIKIAELDPFVLYTLRHTCLTRWAEHMDPYTLAYLAGHSHFATTKRYVHPEQETVLAAMDRVAQRRIERAKTRHKSGHIAKSSKAANSG
jgi:integrase